MSSSVSRSRSSTRRFTAILNLHRFPDVLPDSLNVIAALGLSSKFVDAQPVIVCCLDISQVANIDGAQVADRVQKLFGDTIGPPALISAAQKECCIIAECRRGSHEFFRRRQIGCALGGWH